MSTINKKTLQALEAVAQVSGFKAFFIQDTETTGLNEQDDIYELGGYLYNNGQVKRIHYYLEKPAGAATNLYNTLKNTIPQGHNESPWKNIISDEDYYKLASGTIKQLNGAYFLKTEDAVKLIKDLSKIPNITYNAVFDIEKEIKLVEKRGQVGNNHVKFGDIYDAATMVIDIFPQILNVTGNQYDNKGLWKLEKIDTYLRQPANLRKLGITGNYPRDFGGKHNLTSQQHTAISDVQDMLIPVLGVIAEIFKQNKNWNFTNFKNKQYSYIPKTKIDSNGNKIFKSDVEYQKEIDDRNKKMAKTGQSALVIPFEDLKKEVSGIIAKGFKTGGFGKVVNFDGLMSLLPTEVINGSWHEQRLQSTMNSQKGKVALGLMKHTQKGGNLNTGKLLQDVDSALRSKGFAVEYDYHTYSKQITVILIPNDPAFLYKYNTGEIKNLPQFSIPLAKKDGTINMYGMKAVNKLFTDYINGQSVMITAEQAQLVDLISAVHKIPNSTAARNYDHIISGIKGALRKSLQTLHAAQSFATGQEEQETVKELFGVGSARQLWIRQNFLDNSRYIVHFMDKFPILVESYWKQGTKNTNTLDDAANYVESDLNDILNIIGTLNKSEAIQKIEHSPKFKYITSLSVWKTVKEEFYKIGRLGFTPGSSGEESVRRRTVSLLDPSVLVASGFGMKDKRYGVQTSNIRLASHKSKEYRQKFHARVFNEDEIRAGIGANNVEEAWAAYGYATTADVDKAYKDVKKIVFASSEYKGLSQSEKERKFKQEYGSNNVGLHSGGSVFKLHSDFQDHFMDAVDISTKTIQNSKVLEYLARRHPQYFVRVDGKFAVDQYNNLIENDKISEDKRAKWYKDAVCHVAQLKTDQFGLDDIFDVNGGEELRIKYMTAKPMVSGTKILTRVDGDRTDAQGIHPAVFQQLLKNKGLNSNIDILKNVDSAFDGKHIEGLVGGYVNAIVHAADLRNIKGQGKSGLKELDKLINAPMLNGVPNPLQGIMGYDNNNSNGKTFVVKTGGWEKALQKYHLNTVLAALNFLGEKYLNGPGFKRTVEIDPKTQMETEKWSITSHYIAYSAVNQANVSEYGDPDDYIGKRVVKLDYKAIQSVERSIKQAMVSTGVKMTGLLDYITKQIKPDPALLKEYKQVKADIERAKTRSAASAREDFDRNSLTNAVRVGWGATGAGNVDLSEIQSTDIYNDKYQFDNEKYMQSVFGAIDKAKLAKAKELGLTKKSDIDNIEVYIDLEKSVIDIQNFGGGNASAMAMRYLFLPNFSKLSKDPSDKHYGDMPAYVREFSSLIHNIVRYNDAKNVGAYIDSEMMNFASRIGKSAISFQKETYNEINYKERSTYKKYHKNRVRHSMSGVAMAGNFTAILDNGASLLEKNIASTDGIINPSDLLNMIMQDESSGKTEKAQIKAKLSHIGILQEQINDLFSGQSDVATILEQFVGAYVRDNRDIDKLKKRQQAEENSLRKSLSRKHLSATEMEKELHKFSVKCQQELANAANLSKQELWPIIKEVMFGTSDNSDLILQKYPNINRILSEFITQSVTLGSDVFNARTEANQLKGVAAIFARYPFSNGLDLKFTQMYADNGVAKGRITIGLGTGHAVNLDFDGDHPPLWLPMLSSDNLGSTPASVRRNWVKLSNQYKHLQQWQKNISGVLAYFDAIHFADDEKNIGSIKDSAEKEALNFQAQVEAALTGRKFKGSTGSLSNTYQAVTNAMYQFGIDEKGLRANNKQSRVNAMRSLVVRAFFEYLTQDAISSKKVFNRLKNIPRYKDGAHGVNTDIFLYDFENILLRLKQSSTYTPIALDRLFHDLTEMGLTDIGDRITVQVIAAAAELDKTGTAFKEIFGVNKNNFMFMKDSQGNVIGFNGETDPDKVLKEINKYIGKDAKEAKIFTENLYKKMLLSLNESSEFSSVGGIAGAISRKDFRPGMSQATSYLLGDTYRKIYENANAEVKVLLQNEMRVQKELEVKRKASLQTGVTTINTKGSNISLITTVEQFLDDLSRVQKMSDADAAKEAHFVMAGVVTGLNTNVIPGTSIMKHETYIKPGVYEKQIENKLSNLTTYSVTQIASVLHTGKNYTKEDNNFALEYGTLQHEIIEAIYNNEIPREADGCISQQSLINWIEKKWKSTDDNDKIKVIAAIWSDPKDANVWHVNDQILSKLLQSSNSFITQMATVYGSGVAPAGLEETHGIVLRIGKKAIVISGTIDQLWQLSQDTSDIYGISDIKTSAYPYLEYVIQTSLYSAIIRAMDGSDNAVSRVAHLFMNARATQGTGIINVDTLDENQLASFIEEAVEILECNNVDQRKIKIMNLVRHWNPILQSRLHMTGEMQTIVDKEGNSYNEEFVGGAKLSTILKMKESEFPLTANEEWLWNCYVVQRDKGARGTGSFEEFVLYCLKHKKFGVTKEIYEEHCKFRGARAQYIQEFLESISDQATRERVTNKILNEAANREDTIFADFAKAYYGITKGTTGIQFENIEEYNKQYAVNSQTYNWDKLISMKEEDEEDMAKTEELVSLLINVLENFRGNSSSGNGLVGHASNGAPAGSTSSTINAAQNTVINGQEVRGTNELINQYAKLLWEKELEQVKINNLDPSDTKRRDLENAFNAKFGEGTENPFTKIEEQLKLMYVGHGMTEKEALKQVKTDVELAEKRRDEDETFEKERQEKEKQNTQELEKQRDIYKEILELQLKIDQAKRKGQDEYVEQLEKDQKELQDDFDQARSEYGSEDEFNRFVIDPVNKEMAAKKAREKALSRQDDEKEYIRLLKQQESIDKQLYDNDLTYSTTYDRHYRASLNEQQDMLIEQRKDVASKIEDLKNKDIYKDDERWANFLNAENANSQARLGTGFATVDVKHRGQDTLWGQLGAQFSNTLTRFTQMGAAYKIIGQIRTGMMQVVNAAKDLDKTLTTLRIVSGENVEQAEKMITGYNALGKELSATTQEVASAATDWIRQGYKINEVNELVTASLYLSKLGMIDTATATKDLTSALKGFHLQASQAMDVVDKLTTLDINAATTAGDIAEGLAQFANVATLNGVDIDQASAMVATIADVTQQSGSAVGNSLKMIMSRYSNVKSGAFTSEEDGEALNDTEKVLRKVGISIRDTNLQFRSFADVMDEIAEKWNTMDNVTQNAIAGALAGTRQRESLVTIFQNWDKYQDLLSYSKNSTGTAQKKYLSYQEQLEASQKRLTAAWESLATNADINKLLKGINDVTTFLVDKLPVILRYVSRIVATANAYKLPTALKSIKGFMGVSGVGALSSRKAATDNYYMNRKDGSFISAKDFSGLSSEQKGAYRHLSNYEQSTLTGTRYSNSMVYYLKNIASNVAAIRSKKGLGNNAPSADGSEYSAEQQQADQDLINGKTSGSAEQVAAARQRQATFKAQQDEEAEKLKEAKTTNKKMTALTVGVGTLTNILSARTSAVNYANFSKTVGKYNQLGGFLDWTQQTQEASGDAQIGSKVTTGLASVAGGVIGGIVGKSAQGAALGTQVGGIIGDILSKYVVMPMIDADYNQVQAAISDANQTLSTLGTTDNYINGLSDLANKGFWSNEDYTKAKEYTDSFLNTMYEDENDETRKLLEDYLTAILNEERNGNESSISLYDTMQQYMNGSEEERQLIIRALQVASLQAQNEATWDSLMEKRAELQSRTNQKVLGTMVGNTFGEDAAVALASAKGGPIGMIVGAVVNTVKDVGEHFVTSDINDVEATNGYNDATYALGKAYSEAGFDVQVGNSNFWASLGAGLLNFVTLGFVDLEKVMIDTSNMTLDEQLTAFEKLRENELAKENTNTQLVNSAEEMIREIQDIKAETEKIYKQINEGAVQEALLQTKLGDTVLAGMTTTQLKKLGVDQIVAMVAEYIEDNGGLKGHEVYVANGSTVLTSYAEDLIRTLLKSDSVFGKIATGEAYKISEVMKLPAGKTRDSLMLSFANALGISLQDFEERYAELITQYGDATLAELLETPAEVREHINDCANLLKQMASSTGLTAQNIEEIIAKFPELIPYINDASELATKLMTNIGNYRQRYAQSMFDTLLSNEDYYSSVILPLLEQNLTPEEMAAFNADSTTGNATKVESLIAWMGKGGSLANKVKDIIQQGMNQSISAEIDSTIKDAVISYREKLLDLEIDNLNQQKEALSEINKQREYENSLIEAKLKLENAQKEKKRVYREGVGWTYESDQNAIAEAQANLEEVENQKKISELEAQIAQLTSEKEMLSGLADENELNNLKTVYEAWAESNNLAVSSTASLIDALNIYISKTMVTLGLITDTVDANTQNRNNAQQHLKDLYEGYTDEEGVYHEGLSYLYEHRNDSPEAAAAYNEALATYRSAYDSYTSQGLIEDNSFNRTYNKSTGSYDYAESDSSKFGSESSYNAASRSQANSWEDVNPDYYYYFKTFKNGNRGNAGRKDIGRVFKRGDQYTIDTSRKMWTDAIVHDGDLVYWAVDGNNIASGVDLKDSYTREWQSPADMPDGIYWSWDNDWPNSNFFYLSLGGVGYKLNQKATYGESDRDKYNTGVYNTLDPVRGAYVYDKGWNTLASGTLSARGGTTLLNELGTEAIITPEGTITTLPSSSGVIPADITRSLWQLGELSPMIANTLLGGVSKDAPGTRSYVNSTDESLNINSLIMNVAADNNFDVDAFANALRSRLALSKNNRR